MAQKTPFNEILINQRNKLGLTVRDMAEKVGVTHAVLARLENAQNPVKVITAVKIA